MDALEVINGWSVKGRKVRSRNALASGHLWRWIWQMNHGSEKQGGNVTHENREQLSDSVSFKAMLCSALGTRSGNTEQTQGAELHVIEETVCWSREAARDQFPEGSLEK